MNAIDNICQHVRQCSLHELRVQLTLLARKKPEDFRVVERFLLNLEKDKKLKE